MPSSLSSVAPDADTSSSPLLFAFSLRAVAEPGVMPRVLELFAKRGLVPQRWSSAAADAALTIDIQMPGLERATADYIARCMRQIHGVETVFTVETRHPG